MLLKLRPYHGRSEVIVDITKSSTVRQLVKEACSRFGDVSENELDLIFCGQFMDRNVPLLVYKLKDNDVIGVRIKCSNNNNVSPEAILKTNSTNDNTTKEFLSETETTVPCKYFNVEDKVYYQDNETGRWCEATVTEIDKLVPDEDDSFIFWVHDGVLNQDRTVKLTEILPCGSVELSIKELKVGMDILAYTNYYKMPSGWYHVRVTEVALKGKPRIKGTIFVEDNIPYPNEHIEYCYRTILFPELVPRSDWLKMTSDLSLISICSKCKGHPALNCTECSCVECGGKNDEDKQLLCEECEDAYHMYCVKPPVMKLPDDDWFCPSCCHIDKELEQKHKKVIKKKIEMAKVSVKSAQSRDWGRGKSTAAVANKFCVVPKDHFGRIPGVPSGRCWLTRLEVCRYGVHRPPVAGISGNVNVGVQSLCFSGGYAGDYDNGYEFVMSGSGGRDLSGNKRTNGQSFSQSLTSCNLALAQSCHAKVNYEVGTASSDWQKGLPIRVVRGYKLAKLSKYAPVEGYRYDGIYKVVKYYKETFQGTIMWKYQLRRDDDEPAPWTKEGMKFMEKMSVGFVEGKEEGTENPPKIAKEGSRKRKLSEVSACQPAPIRKIVPYVLDSQMNVAIKNDTLNKRNWDIVTGVLNDGYPAFIKALADQFCCIICQDVCKDPFTPQCGHNTCLNCIKKWTKNSSKVVCTLCSGAIDVELTVNTHLDEVLNFYLAGYNSKVPQPAPFFHVKK